MTTTSAEQLARAAWKLHQAGRLEKAIKLYRQAAKLSPDYAEIHNNLGNALSADGKLEDATVSLARAVELKPSIASAHSNLGLVLAELGRLEEAVTCHRRALALQPHLALAHNNLGIALLELRQHSEAADCFRRAITLDPGMAAAHANLGDALRVLERQQETREVRDRYLVDALESYRRAIELRPSFGKAYANMGEAKAQLGDLPGAAASLRRALELEPNHGQAMAQYVFRQRQMCDWRDEPPLIPAFKQAARGKDKGFIAFTSLALADNPALQLELGQHDCSVTADTKQPPLWHGEMYRHDRIRLGYISHDFNDHTVAYTIAPLIELHDRSRFEVHGFSLSFYRGSAIGTRLRNGFDHYHEVRELSDRAIARVMRDAEIDIAIDLMGHTTGSRLKILAHRPAPIQASYLAYAASTGARFIDYLVADHVVAPLDQAENFSEKIVHVPPSFLFNDAARKISEAPLRRSDYGLPEQGFVFCCFNACFKITPEIFSLWMKLLRSIPGSVLWLRVDNDWAIENLRREAASRGVNPGRLVFARGVGLSEHLARHRLADLFIDTLPYNAHTTAADALFAGLPILTCAGQSFAARVASSMLEACGLTELITGSLEDYESMALDLARHPEKLAILRDKLERNRLTSPLFDNEQSARNIEDAYRRMWSRWQAGEAPAHLPLTSP